MSDVDLSGVFAVFIGLFLVALAVVWALVALLVVRLRSRVDFAARGRRALVGPAICGAPGAALYAAMWLAPRSARGPLDRVALVALLAAPIVGVVATVWTFKRRR